MNKNQLITIITFGAFLFTACTQEVSSKDDVTKKDKKPIELTDTPPGSPYTELEN